MLPLLTMRPDLRARLLERKYSLAVAAGDVEITVKMFAESAAIARPPQSAERDVQRLGTLVKLGQSLLSLNRKAEAAKYFEQVLAYRWYTLVDHPGELRMAREHYVQAGRGLIESRRGDLAALAQIVFVPATYETLGPVLEKAMREARGAR